jgi:sigma-E factor negative regulatory protein RseB
MVALRLFFIFALVPSAYAADPAALLQAMSKKAQNHNYTGTLLIKNSKSGTESFKISHSSSNQEKIEALDGKPAAVVVDNHGSLVYAENEDSQVIRNPFLDTFVGAVPRLYNLRYAGIERVMGKPANLIEIKPKDNLRYGYKLWIDADNDMYMRAQWFDRNRLVLEANLTNYQPSPSIESAVSIHEAEPLVALKADQVPATRKNRHRRHLCKVNWLPQGFKLLRKTEFSYDSDQTEHLLFSDGIAKISVYLDFAGQIPNGDLEIGRTNIHSMAMGKDKKIVVVGEVPLATARRIARSVELPR